MLRHTQLLRPRLQPVEFPYEAVDWDVGYEVESRIRALLLLLALGGRVASLGRLGSLYGFLGVIAEPEVRIQVV